jgi:ComF family protein
MIDTVLAFLAPHHCLSCSKVGSLLCNNCKYDIVHDAVTVCIICKKPTGEIGICRTCRPYFERAWTVAPRVGALESVIDFYKFERARAGYRVLGDLLLARLPELPKVVVVVPIPTIAPHIRERGYDHSLLVARYVARKRGLKLEQLLTRRTTTMQRGSSKSVRKKQAAQAYYLRGNVDLSATYLLVDDIVTTGATLDSAARILRDAGASHVWVAAVAYQTLD